MNLNPQATIGTELVIMLGSRIFASDPYPHRMRTQPKGLNLGCRKASGLLDENPAVGSLPTKLTNNSSSSKPIKR